MLKRNVIAGAVLALTLFGSAAHAHVTVQPTEAPAGAFFKFVVRVPNERDVPTTKVEVRFPENLAFVGFQPKPGWQRNVKMKKLDEPIEISGAEIDEVIGSVTWSGGTIGVGEFEEFAFSARVPEDEGELVFPAFQTYEGGEVVEWTGAPDSDEPAGRVQIVALGTEEDQGELALLADIKQQVDELAANPVHDMSGSETDDDDDSGESTGVVLGGIGIGLGLLALIVALTKKRA